MLRQLTRVSNPKRATSCLVQQPVPFPSLPGAGIHMEAGNKINVHYTHTHSKRMMMKCTSNTNTRSFYSSSPKNQQKDNSSSKSQTKAPPPRDTRMAGRRRFYKVVDVIEASPPWDHFAKEEETVDNPISAGVDGTNSATNISLEKPTRSSMISSLTPSSLSSSSSSEADVMQWYGISLDGRAMKTPLGMPLSVPSFSLALAIASEWNDQKHTIQPAQMPLMTLVCTTIDQMTIPSVRTATIDKIISYLKNDTTCYWADPTEDRVLHRKQSQSWTKLHEWISNDDQFGLGVKPAVALGAGEGLIMSRMRKNKQKSSAGLPHDEQLVENARLFLESCDAWTLSAMQNVTMEAKSFLVGMGVVRGLEKKVGPFDVDVDKAVVASRVEEEFQIENWGLVEGGHDYDRLNCSIQIHAATVLIESIIEANTISAE